jgi:Protein of unknown function (DUF1349)
VQVRVSGDFEPGEQSTLRGSAPFLGAGLLVWQDDSNFLRLERNAFRVAHVPEPVCYPPLLEYYQDGRYVETNPPTDRASFFQGPATSLRLRRRGETMAAAYSHDGKEWSPVKEIQVQLPRKVWVGVAVTTTATRPFTATFEDFKLSTKE